MSTATIRIITGAVLILHGIGHAMALVPALNIFSTDSWNYRSWLLTGVIGDSFSRVLVILLFGAAFLGFIAAGLGFFEVLVPHSAWQTLAIVSAVVSVVALVLFWNAFASLFPNKIGATVVNIATVWVVFGSGTFSEMIKAF